ncbi:DUF721 domain-containing protein [Streptomyces jumonjinensis]|uniref:DciA family protein n=1 Tax=Streptomyces jumonjinensis TaxID=1945 RepID=UPI001E4DF722|nr:DciA family protein [Streptomyces jumonjinensis]
MMMTERGMVAPAAGGSVPARWEAVLAAATPELTGHVQAMTFDADTGRLDVAPDTPAYGTKLCWSTPKLIDAANAKVPDAHMRTLRILPPGGVDTPAAPVPGTTSAREEPAPAGPSVGPRKMNSGYMAALTAHQEHKNIRDLVRTGRSDYVRELRDPGERVLADLERTDPDQPDQLAAHHPLQTGARRELCREHPVITA